jgi:two-component system, cell cycle response regulator
MKAPQEDPRTTLKFEKVVPRETPFPTPFRDPSEPLRAPSARPNLVSSWPDDDRPTHRDMSVAVSAPTTASAPNRALLTILVGLNAGQVFPLDTNELVLGRGRDANVSIDDVGISRKHARVVRTDERRHILEDLGSANGVFVNGRRVQRADLANGDRVQLGPTVVLRFSVIAADEEALARKLYEGSTRDAMTGLYNRKYAGERLAAEVAYAHRHKTLLSLVLFDLDHFKLINDSFGHPAGDVVLRVVAAQVRKAVRTEDVVARYGGEEFVVLVRGIEHVRVGVLADRIRGCVQRLAIPWESQTLKVTVSVGVASLSECGLTANMEPLVALADERLYRAKAGGRNCVCSADPSSIHETSAQRPRDG